LVERQFITILFANVNVSGFVKVGMKLLNIEMLVTRIAIREISLNMEDFTSVRLATQDALQVPTPARQRLLHPQGKSEYVYNNSHFIFIHQMKVSQQHECPFKNYKTIKKHFIHIKP
jgi:hypothetical protein